MKPVSQKKEAGIWVLAAVLLVASISLGLGVFVFNATHKIYLASDAVARNWLPSVQSIGKIRSAMTQLRREGGHIVIYGETCEARRCLEIMEERKQALSAAEGTYAPLVTSGEEQSLFDTYRRQRDIYLDIQQQLISRPDGERSATLEEFITRSDDAYDRVTTTLGRLAEFNSEGGRKAQVIVDHNYERTQLGLYVLNFLLLGLAAAFTAKIVSVASHQRH